MYHSDWCFILYAKKLASAQKVMNRVFKILELEPTKIEYSPNEKPDFMGYRVHLVFEHDIDGSWGDAVVHLIELGQRLGGNWTLYNSVNIQPSGVLTDKARIIVVGIAFIEWDLPNPNIVLT